MTHIFNSNENIFSQQPDIESESVYYTIVGQQDGFVESFPIKNNEDHNVYAKKITRKDRSTKYLIKIDGSAKLVNPLSVTDEQTGADLFVNDVCRTNKRFREVNPKAFEWYLKFLSTKNIAWLYNAERESY